MVNTTTPGIFFQMTKTNRSGKTTTRRKTAPRKRKSRKKQNSLLRFLRRTPSWLLWFSGIIIACLYAFLLYYIFVGPFSMRWRAQFGKVPEPVGFEVRGIDISHYQRTIDWAKVKEAEIGGYPVEFAIVKATEGVRLKDSHYRNNIRQARRMNIIAGAYHFFIPGSDARTQALYYINNVELRKGDLPPILDVEKKGALSTQQLQNDVLVWLEMVEKHYGVRPIIYANYDFKRNYLNTPKLNEYPLWLARYYKETPEYNEPWKIWQYTDIGEVDGIKGKVDCNVFNGTRHDLLQMLIK